MVIILGVCATIPLMYTLVILPCEVVVLYLKFIPLWCYLPIENGLCCESRYFVHFLTSKTAEAELELA